jgi:hypothetical protein
MNQVANSLFRFVVFGLSFAGAIIGFLAIMGISGLVLPILLGSVGGVTLLVLVCWGGSRLLGQLFLGNDPAYQQWCRRSDPWFDTLPPPFGAPDRHHAPYQCLRCSGGMSSINGVCPSCGFGRNELVCPCGLEVVQPQEGAFETTGVICPRCKVVLWR